MLHCLCTKTLDRCKIFFKRIDPGGYFIKNVQIFKIDKMKQVVFGPVLIPNIEDLQGDIITEEEIENAAYDYMIKSRVTGFRHEKELDAVIVESYIVKNDSWFRNGDNQDEYIPKGSWVVGMKILDDKVWEGVLDGTYNSFSIGGFGVSTPIEGGVDNGGGGN